MMLKIMVYVKKKYSPSLQTAFALINISINIDVDVDDTNIKVNSLPT